MLYVVLGALLIGPFAAFVIGWFMFPVPESENVALNQVATFTFADGESLATVKPEQGNRILVPLDNVPEHVRMAVLSAEDRSFYSNPGFDVIGIARAVREQLTGGSGGGSTITQQYIKVSTGQDDVTLWRKYKEVILAVKISREQTKDEILENYLNTIYFGRGAYGIQAAANAYFGKDIKDVTLSEGAMLAGAIQSPSRWDPAKNPDDSLRRWNFVLDGMVDQRWVEPGVRAQQQFPTNWLPEPPSSGGVPDDSRYHIYDRAVAELEQHGITQDMIDTEGLTVTTTVDQPLQEQAVESVTERVEEQPEELRYGLVSIDPETGAIKTYYGGQNGLGTDYAMAFRQPGSSFKPFVLSAALQSNQGIGLGTQYEGTGPKEFPGREGKVRNVEGAGCERCGAIRAMTNSINTWFYQMGLDVGPDNVARAAHQAGIPEDLLPDPSGGIALGDKEVHPVDMASAYATFAANGVYHEPHIVSRVVAADGRVLYEAEEPEGRQAVPPQVARNVTEAMLKVLSSKGLSLPDGRQVAAKTGTAQLAGSGGENRDAWLVGYTPSVATAVWVGTDESDPIRNAQNRPIYGSGLPTDIWHEFMEIATEDVPAERFPPFVPMGQPPRSEPPPTSDEDESSEEDEDEDSDSDGDSDSDSRSSDEDDEDSSSSSSSSDSSDSSDSSGSSDSSDSSSSSDSLGSSDSSSSSDRSGASNSPNSSDGASSSGSSGGEGSSERPAAATRQEESGAGPRTVPAAATTSDAGPAG